LAPANDDKVSFKGFFTYVPTSPTVDPISNGMRFLVQDSTGATPVDVTIPGGAYNGTNKVGWKVNGSGTSWTYKNAGTSGRGSRHAKPTSPACDPTRMTRRCRSNGGEVKCAAERRSASLSMVIRPRLNPGRRGFGRAGC
jgi:hypothetical protein